MAGVKSSSGGLDKIRIALEGLERGKLSVGFFPSATYTDGTKVAYVAAIQELGDPSHSIPPRPFMRPTAEARQRDWAALVARQAKAALTGKTDPLQVLEILGLTAAADVADTIRNITSPAISPVTSVLRQWKRGGIQVTGKSVGLAARLLDEGLAAPLGGTADKPLVDSGILLDSVSFEVTE